MGNPNQKENKTFELKGSLFTLTVFHLLTDDLSGLNTQLETLVKQTPKFFHHMPVVIDLHRLPKDSAVNFSELIHSLREHHLIPVGVRSGNDMQHQAAAEIGLAIFPNSKAEQTEVKSIPEQTPSHTQTAKIITHPVRSGQQIYARKADLIVLAPVSPGAELLADGNIHIYGSLRGRALAGVTGNEECRIFCQQLEAELVSIAGHYWVNEDLQNVSIKENTHIYLENDRLHVAKWGHA